MRRFLATLLVALSVTACTPDLDGITALNNGALRLSQQGIVQTVLCPDSLSIAETETANCVALNAEGTRIAWEGVPVITGGWRSTDPLTVSVDLAGRIQAESTPGTVWIVAEGMFESADSVQVTAY